MLKILTAAWLQSTAKARIQVIAGLYHSGTVRPGLTGPLVGWICHPRRTAATGRIDSIRALVSLPDSGTGVQSDALSLAFMLDRCQGNREGKDGLPRGHFRLPVEQKLSRERDERH